MSGIIIRKRGNKKYIYSRTRTNGKLKEKYLGKLHGAATGVVCTKCGTPISEKVVRKAIKIQLQKMQRKMWNEKKHISDYAQYEIIGILIDAFSDSKKSK